MSTEIQVQPPGQLAAPDGQVMIAGMPVNLSTLGPTELGQMMDLHERWENRQAEKDLCAALADFQAACPPIPKNRTIARKSGPPTPYAGFEDVQGIVKPYLAKFGLSTSFDTKSAGPKMLTAICTVRHRSGAKMTGEFTVEIDGNLSANVTQQYGSALTYAKRYALGAALSLIIGEPDDDGHSAGVSAPESITADQVKHLEFMLKQLPFDGKDEMEKFLPWAGAATLAEIPADKYDRIVKRLTEIIADL